MLLQVIVLAQAPFFCERMHGVHSVLLSPRLKVLSMSLLHRLILCNLQHWGASTQGWTFQGLPSLLLKRQEQELAHTDIRGQVSLYLHMSSLFTNVHPWPSACIIHAQHIFRTRFKDNPIRRNCQHRCVRSADTAAARGGELAPPAAARSTADPTSPVRDTLQMQAPAARQPTACTSWCQLLGDRHAYNYPHQLQYVIPWLSSNLPFTYKLPFHVCSWQYRSNTLCGIWK